jgi:probable HAF family extracellular repeat protein
MIPHGSIRSLLSSTLLLSFATVASATTPPPAGYAGEFVSTAAFASSMNAGGDVTGTSYPDPGCGPFCLPPLETVVWKGGTRIVLPPVPGFTGIYVRGINAQGWVVGLTGVPYTTTHAVVWKPNGTSYTAIDLGTLPGTTSSEAFGIDDLGRVVGWSTTQFFPPTAAPFMWTEAGGMVDLTTLGFPNEQPFAISPGGAVATPSYWYRLDDPSSVVALPAPPQGFYPPGSYPMTINDAGEQARFLVSTSTENLIYLFRFHTDGTWQQISFAPQGHLSSYGIGSINAAGDVTATVLGTAQIAYGPDGITQPLAPLLSLAYPGAVVTAGGTINDAGHILAQVMIGNSSRLMRLSPAEPCATSCLRSANVQISAKFIQDPRDPGHCSLNLRAYNKANVRVTVTNEFGTPVSGVTVSGRFLDDYWANAPFTATTNGQGIASFSYKGRCGVGAIAFLVDSMAKAGSTLDKSTGILSAFAIPRLGLDLVADAATADDGAPDAASSPGLDLATVLPSPAAGSATLRYTLPDRAHVTLRVFDGGGAVLATVVDRDEDGGVHTVTWSGGAAPRGIYWAEIQAGDQRAATRFLLVR